MTAIAVFERGPGRPAPVGLGRRDRESSGASREIQIGDAIGETASRRTQPPVPAADAGVGRRRARPRRRRAAPRRARAARRAGPADQRPAGRHRARRSRSRSTARCRRKSSRRRWRTTSASTSPSARRRRSTSSARSAPARRSRSCTRTRIRSSPRSGCASSPRPTGVGHRVPTRRRPSHGAAVHLQDARELHGAHGRVRPRDAAGGPLRLAGHRLHRDDDRVRLQRPRRSAVQTRDRSSTAADFRKLTPLVLMQALERAGTVVCEPIVRVEHRDPDGRRSAPFWPRWRGSAASWSRRRCEASSPTIETVMPGGSGAGPPAAAAGLTGGEGVLESSFAGYQPVGGRPPTRCDGRWRTRSTSTST